MKPARKMSLSKKLPLFITLPALCFIALAGLVQFWQFSKVLNAQNQETYTTVIKERTAALSRWMKTIEDDVSALAANVAIRDAITDFTSAWVELGNGGADRLRDLYIHSNPHPNGEKDELVIAGDGSNWSRVHQEHHEGLRAFQRVHGYYDLFLFDTAGNLIYSVFKEDDFGLNFFSGQYATSGLGEVFQKGVKLSIDEVYVTGISPYAPSAGAPAMFLSKPVFKDGTRIGVVALQVPFGAISEILSDSILLGETGRVILVGEDGRILSQSATDTNVASELAVNETQHFQAAQAGEDRFFTDVPGLYGPEVVAATSSVMTPDGERWGLVLEKSAQEALAEKRDLQFAAAIGLILTAFALCATCWIVGQWIAKRFVQLARDTGAIANENYDIVVAGTDSGDEIGEMAQTLEAFKSRLQEGAEAQLREEETQKGNRRVVELLSDALMSLAQGDFRNQITEFFPFEHKKLRYSINDAMSGLNKVVIEVGDAAFSIQKGAGEIYSAAEELSSRTESQAATLEQTAAAIEQITVSVRSATDNVRTVEAAAADAKEDAEASGKVVSETIAAMHEIEASSKHIEQIIGVIDDIAFQTNLLALNAGVEAARAGEAGKGFAVVASEVRALAQRASDAALEIKTLIGQSSHQVDRGVDLVDRTGQALQAIVERVTNISDLVTQIARSSEEQASALSEINTGVTQLDNVTQDNAAMVEETTASSHLLSTDALKLNQLVSAFKTDNTTAETGAPPNAQFSNPVSPLEGPPVGPELDDAEPEMKLVSNEKWQDF